MNAQSRAPVFIPEVLEKPEVFERLIERHGPYLPVQRYFANEAEHRASSARGPMIIAPNFRGDWAYDRPLVEGAELFLEHEGFARAASQLFDGGIVRPQIVYTNLTWQLPFEQGAGHTDVPAFRGIDRTRHPIWLLNVMGHSGLFEDERIRIATAVAWFYRGRDGGFEYWPDGPGAASRIHEGEIFNTAILGDNDRMFHRVRPVGRREDGLLPDMTLETRLEHLGDGVWGVFDGEACRARFAFEDLRISVSWKAQVFRDEREREMVDSHESDLTLDRVFARFQADLEARGIASEPSRDPLRDPELVDRLAGVYVVAPGASG